MASLLINLALLIVCVAFVQADATTTTSADSFDYIDLMQVQNLTFYRDYFTVGPHKRLQLNCISGHSDECDEQPVKFFCVNNDFNNLAKVNASRLSWSCQAYQLLNSVFVEENSEDVQCEEGERTATQRMVISGSCYLTFTLSRNWIYRSWLFLIIAVLVLLLVISLIFYLRQRKRRSGYVSV